MGKPRKPGDDKAICGTLCICQATAVLSSVALIYLSVIIYLPSKREIDSGIAPHPVMCTTIDRQHMDNDIAACSWSSCTEWCLSKASVNVCEHLYVSVRQNGTDIEFEECQVHEHKKCIVMADVKEKKKNCKIDLECITMNHLFLCEMGICQNITDVYSCSWRPEDTEPSLNCQHKRHCVELDGMYNCINGRCTRLLNWKCERKCVDITTANNNVVTMAGDHIVTANCRRAINTRTGDTVWEAADHDNRILVSSCTGIYNTTEGIGAEDCVNGSLIPSHLFESSTNLTQLMATFHNEGWKYKLDQDDNVAGLPRVEKIPFDTDIMIYNRSALLINHEGCVNTLQFECKQFYESHGQDSRNQSSPDRFPCYYSAENSEFVVQRFDLHKTKNIFLVFFSVPAVLLVVSCFVLFVCSRCINVDRQGTMGVNNTKCGNNDDLQFDMELQENCRAALL